MEFDVDLPSGCVIRASDLHGRDIAAIAERVGGNASGDTIAAMLSCCTKAVLDPGPYPFLSESTGSPEWKRMLWGDLFAAIIKIRVESFPDHRGAFDFEFSCPYCRALQPGSIDLEQMLADVDHFAPLPEESKAIMLANRWFEFTLPTSGQTVEYDLARLEQDEPIRQLMRREKITKETDPVVIAKRVKGVKELVSEKTGQQIRDQRSIWRWTKGLGANDIDALLADMSRSDIHVNAKVLTWCRSAETDCGRQCRISLPLDVSFFRPRSGTMLGETGKRSVSGASSRV